MKAIICGTKRESIGRYIADELVRDGWDVWLYSRIAENCDTGMMHERRADITCEEHIAGLVTESGNPDLVVMSADTGGVFGSLKDIGACAVREFLDAKLLGSVLFVQRILLHGANTKIVFLAGKIGPKCENFLLYGMVNSAIMSLVEEVNRHYQPRLEAYYLETPLISESTIAKQYAKVTGKSAGGCEPSVVLDSLREILQDKHAQGFVPCVSGKVL